MNNNSLIRAIVVGDLYQNNNFHLKDQKLSELHSLKYNKSNFVSAYLHGKDFISSIIKINKGVPSEDIDSVIEIKAYEELGLDQSTQYNISYIENEEDEKDRNFMVFATDSKVIYELGESITDKVKYVDLLMPEPLLYKTLYTNEILQKNSKDIFINFDEDNTQFSLYSDGELLYSKTMEHTLNKIYERHCEIIGENTDKEELFKVLVSEGLKGSDPEYNKSLANIFGDIFVNINDIIIYLKRNFEIDHINHLFIGSSKGIILGLDGYSENYLGIETTPLEFNNKNIESDSWYIDQSKLLLAMSAVDYLKEDSKETYLYDSNLTIFNRPPPFPKRASGQFIIALGFSIMIATSYPMYFLFGSYINESTTYILKKKETELAKEATNYKTVIKHKNDTNNGILKRLKVKEDIFKNKKKNLTSIYNKKVKYNMKSERLAQISERLKEFELNVEKISLNKNKYEVSVISKTDVDFTRFIESISREEFDNILNIDIKQIKQGDSEDYYTGILEVEFNEIN